MTHERQRSTHGRNVGGSAPQFRASILADGQDTRRKPGGFYDVHVLLFLESHDRAGAGLTPGFGCPFGHLPVTTRGGFGSRVFHSFALRRRPLRIERFRRSKGGAAIRGRRGGWRLGCSCSWAAPFNLSRAITRRGSAKTTRIKAALPEPIGQAAHVSTSFQYRGSDSRDRDTKGSASAGTAFWKAGNVFR